MADKFSRQKRSEIMSKIRGKNTLPERLFRMSLVRDGIKGWKMHYRIIGKPDFVFLEEGVALFLDSEFWHLKNRKQLDRVNDYWAGKLSNNKKRDYATNRELKHLGWVVIRIYV